MHKPHPLSSLYRLLCNVGDKVVYPVLPAFAKPAWNHALLLIIFSSILIVFLINCSSTKEKKLPANKLASRKQDSTCGIEEEFTIGKLRQHSEECDLSRSMVREKGKTMEDEIPSLSLSFTPTMDEKKNGQSQSL